MNKLEFKGFIYQEINSLETSVNYFSFDLKMFMKDLNKSFNLIREWTNKEHTILLVEYVFEDRNAIDWLQTFLERNKLIYGIDFTFYNPTSLESCGERYCEDTSPILNNFFILYSLFYIYKEYHILNRFTYV